MTLSPATLKLLQQAGQGLFDAQQAVSADVQLFGSRVVALTASQPFNPENDSAYRELRALARMAHELQTMEEQLRALYAQAGEVVRPEMAILTALPNLSGQGAWRAGADKANAQEAVVRAAPDRAAKKARPAIKAGKAKTKTQRPSRPSPNDEKVLTHLGRVLDSSGFKPLTHASIAQAAKMPLGSVGIALRRLAAAGLIAQSNGSYRMGRASTAQSTEAAETAETTQTQQ